MIIEEANTDGSIQDIVDVKPALSFFFWRGEMKGSRQLRAATVFSMAALTVFVMAVAGRIVAHAQGAAAASSVWDGVYTEEQARRGLAVFKERCAACHGEKLEGGGVGPALSGEDFMADWQGKSVDSLFQRTSLTMPADEPGKLTPNETVDVLSYVLNANKFPAGQKELRAVRDALKQIRIQREK